MASVFKTYFHSSHKLGFILIAHHSTVGLQLLMGAMSILLGPVVLPSKTLHKLSSSEESSITLTVSPVFIFSIISTLYCC